MNKRLNTKINLSPSETGYKIKEILNIQAQSMNKKWFDILPEDETLVLNFGLLLQKWSLRCEPRSWV